MKKATAIAFIVVFAYACSTSHGASHVSEKVVSKKTVSLRARKLEMCEQKEFPDHVGDFVGKHAKVIVATAAGFVPKVGSILKGLITAFWPSGQQSTWDSVKDKVKHLVTTEIRRNRLDTLEASLIGIRGQMDLYKVSIDNQLTSRIDSDANNIRHSMEDVKAQLIECNECHHFIPLAVVHMQMHLAMLKEMVVVSRDMLSKDPENDELSRQVNADEEVLENQYYDYQRKILGLYERWENWRFGEGETETIKITEEGDRVTVHDSISCETWSKTECAAFCPPANRVSKRELRRVADAVKQKMRNQAKAKMAGIIGPMFDYVKLLPGNDITTPPDVPELFKVIELGPFSVATTGVSAASPRLVPKVIYEVGDIEKIVVRSWDHVDAIKFFYGDERDAGSPYVGKADGGKAREYINSDARYCVGFADMNFQNGILVNTKVAMYDATTGAIDAGEPNGNPALFGNTGKGSAVVEGGAYKLAGGKFAKGPSHMGWKYPGPALLTFQFKVVGDI